MVVLIDGLIILGATLVLAFTWCFVLAAIGVGVDGLRGWLRQMAEDRRHHPTVVARREARRIRRVGAATRDAMERIDRAASS